MPNFKVMLQECHKCHFMCTCHNYHSILFCTSGFISKYALLVYRYFSRKVCSFCNSDYCFKVYVIHFINCLEI